MDVKIENTYQELKKIYTLSSDESQLGEELRTFRLISPKSKNNNCLIACFISFNNLKGNQCKASKIRKECGLKDGEKIKIVDIGKIADWFKNDYIIFNSQYNIIKHTKKYIKTDYKPIYIYLHNDHYSYAEFINYKYCDHCCKKLLIDNETHECNANIISYRANKIKKHMILLIQNSILIKMKLIIIMMLYILI